MRLNSSRLLPVEPASSAHPVRLVARARVWLVATVLLGACQVSLVSAQWATRSLPDELAEALASIYSSGDYDAERAPRSRWLDGGDSYAILEPAPAQDAGSDAADPAADAPDADGSDADDSVVVDLVVYDTESGARNVLLEGSTLVPPGGVEPLAIEDYSLSADRSTLLVFSNSRKVWRDNTRGDYWVVDLSGKQPPHQLGGEDADEASLMFAKLSPDGRHVAYVRDRDVWLEDLDDGSIERVTPGGSETMIYGTSDWVTEEELGLRDAFRFSPSGARIAYWGFDTSGVGRFTLIDNRELYPSLIEIPYPKVGTTNSAVSLAVVDIATGENRRIALDGDPRQLYVPRLEFVDEQTLLFQRLNRLQNENRYELVQVENPQASSTLVVDRGDAWVELMDEPLWLDDGQLLFSSERDGWRHLYRLTRGASEPVLVTRFEGDVIELVGLDRERGFVYFEASPTNATRRALYRSPVAGGPVERVTPSDEGWHTYDLSPDARWAIHTSSSFERPPRVELVSLPTHQKVRSLVDNDDLAERLQEDPAVTTRFFRVDVEPGVQLDSWLMMPPNHSRERESVPLLIFVYGEPAGQTVLDRWGGRRAQFHRSLARAGVAVASFDNRGTPAPRGAQWRKVVYGAVGELSASDQAAAVSALLRRFPELDAERVGVWGWSGGGSNTLNAMFRHPETYSVGVSVAPVPDQRLYDTIYQERYMGLPQDNEDGYRRGSPIFHAEGLAGRLLLIHGTGDDNVHYQGTERLIDRLIELDKSFDVMVYPNRSHSISEGETTSRHVHTLVARYLLDVLRP